MPVKSGIVGIDEAGRGPWAGPLCAAAVILDRPIEGLNDSKQLSPRRRAVLYEQITARHRYGVALVEAGYIDEFGLSQALRLAMSRAYNQLGAKAETIIIDGNINYLEHLPGSRALISADQRIPAVMAASVVAKVTRDQYMQQLHRRWPVYGFDRHKGYGTPAHRQAIVRHGLCPEHRRSFKPIGAML